MSEDWKAQSEVIDWPSLVEHVHPPDDLTWETTWEMAEELGLDMGLLNWCEDVVARSGNQYVPIDVRDGVVVAGLEQALAWYKYGSKRDGRDRIYVREVPDGG